MQSAYKTQEEFGQFIRLHFARQDIPEQTVVSGMLTLKVLRAALPRVMLFLRDDPSCRFARMTDMTCLHYPDRTDCFTLVYHLTSLLMGSRLRVLVTTQEDVPVASVTGVFPNAGWYEREVREMFGISFEGHPDLRRLLTTDGMPSFPLRRANPDGEMPERISDDVRSGCVSVLDPAEAETP